MGTAKTLSAMSARDDDFNPRPGRIAYGNQGAKRQKSFVGEVMRAAKTAGQGSQTFKRSGGSARRSTFGRGRRAALSLSSRSSGRRVVVMARIVRHRGGRFRSAPLSKHVAYLKREGVTRDGTDARMFDAASDHAAAKAFAERCEADRHHFRLTVSPEDAGQMADLRAFTRELMTGRRARPRLRARLGRGRSLEHRQPPYPCARPRSHRRWAGSGHQPRLHQPGFSRPRRRTA